jgi:hypothetical protein
MVGAGAFTRPAPARWLGLAVWIAGVALLGFAHLQIAGTSRDDEAHPAIANSVRGFVALHAGEAAVLCPSLILPLVLLYLLFERALAVRPSEAQI